MYSSSMRITCSSQLGTAENVRQIADLLQQLLEFDNDLVLLESREAVQAHLRRIACACVSDQPIAALHMPNAADFTFRPGG